jgi:hypothetical protein
MLTVMSSRARRPRRPLAAVPSPTTPPPGGADTAANLQALVERIRAGELDAELPVLAAAIAERQQLLAAAQALITRASLRVGDRVRINHRARPLYLHGQVGTVAGFYGQSVIVRLDQPVGRFVTGELRCPPWPWIDQDLNRYATSSPSTSINGPSYRLKDRLKPSDGGGALERSACPATYALPVPTTTSALDPNTRRPTVVAPASSAPATAATVTCSARARTLG